MSEPVWREYFHTVSLAAKRRLHEPLAREEFAIQSALAVSAELCAEVIAAATDAKHFESTPRGSIV